MIILALSGMDIFKLLPKTNCKDCNSPSCLAFAMKVAAGRALYLECPFLSGESKEKLGGMMEPPILEISLERDSHGVILGGEKVLFRHEESFYHPTAVGVEIRGGLSDEELQEEISAIQSLAFERVGEALAVNFTALSDTGENSFPGYLRKVYEKSSLPLAVCTTSPETVESILSMPGHEGILLATDREIAERYLDALRETRIILGLTANSLESAEAQGAFFRSKNFLRSVVILRDIPQIQVLRILNDVRTQALVSRNSHFSFPMLVWSGSLEGDIPGAAAGVMKYASGVVIHSLVHEEILPLLTLRQNIFTDPRRPVQVEAKLYSFGDVTPDSPVLVTTNFSLTYFTVAQEIEASRIPSYLLVVDTEGTSVLTAWAADRFTGASVIKSAEAALSTGVITHRELVIPGYVSVLKEDIEASSEWKVLIGPREASGIPEYLRRRGARV